MHSHLNSFFEDQTIIHCGYLNKGLKQHGLWKRKFVVIKKGIMTWYDNETVFNGGSEFASTPTPPKTSMETITEGSSKRICKRSSIINLVLSQDVICSIVVGGKPNLFEIISTIDNKPESRYFKAKDISDRTIWMKAIEEAKVAKITRLFAL